MAAIMADKNNMADMQEAEVGGWQYGRHHVTKLIWLPYHVNNQHGRNHMTKSIWLPSHDNFKMADIT
jgi:hypothetical protein